MHKRALLAVAVAALVGATLLAGPAAAGPDGKPDDGASAPADPASTEAGAPEAILTGITQAHGGYAHSCARLANGQARCWGDNSYGELGDQTTDPSDTAVIVLNAAGTAPLQNVRQIVNGDDHTCALLTNNVVRCFGDGSEGALGRGNFNDSDIPGPVRNPANTGPLQGVLEISAEDDGMCALLSSRKVVCWGDDDYGQLGNGAPLGDSNLPVFVKGLGGNGQLTNVRSLGAGYDTNCVALQNGQARCWGYDNDGGLGNGTTSGSPHPVVVQAAATGRALTGVVQIAHGGYHGCAVLTSGQARCWGENDEGQLGTGDTTSRKRAVPVGRVGGGNLTGVRSIFAGYDHSCALLTSGQARCWGLDDEGQNGDGTIESPPFRKRPTPVLNGNGVGNLSGIVRLHSRADVACAVLNNGRARCWGYGEDGQLGNGATDNSALPVLVQV